MKKTLLFVATTLLAYLIFTWFTGSLLGLTGTKLWILRIALGLIGIAAAGVVVWFFSTRQKEKKAAEAGAEEAPSGGGEIAMLIRDAEKKLSSANLEKGAHIGNLPAILLLGETSSTKTTVLLHSGLEPELLAGQVYQEGNVVSTRNAGIWYSRRTLFVEAGGKLLDDAAGRSYLLRRLQPRKLRAVVGQAGQAPRAVLVCVEIERLTGGAQVSSTLARNLRARLGEIAELFGIQLPVYVLFTKTDRLPFFADFVRNLRKEEVTLPLGASLPMPAHATGVYAEEQATRLGGAFDQVFRAMCNARPEFLSRENDASKLPGAYEFPREFRKLRGSLVQFLVDLCRPSQLNVGPFLRGFYFSAVRPVIVQEAAPVPEARVQERQNIPAASEATGMFRAPAAGQVAAAPSPRRVAISRKVPQWLFLSHFFNDVLLADRAAMGASGTSAKNNLWRHALLISAAVLCLILATCFTVSFFLNRGLESRVRDALKGAAVDSPGTTLASLDSLNRLETLRQSLAALTEYQRDGVPLRYRWGLYVGDRMYPSVRRLYFKRFQQVMFGQTQDSLVAFLSSLPPVPGPATPGYDQAYNPLKAYLITTSNHDKSTREFLSPLLLKTWSGNQSVEADRLQLAQKQFDFYTDELRIENPFTKQNDAGVVQRARQYLSHFGDFDRVYQNMKSRAPKDGVNFNRQYPGSANFVIDGYDVAGPFTKQGWNFMVAAFHRPDLYAQGEPWVLGDQGAAEINNHSGLGAQLMARYVSDFIAQWRTYLKSARVTPYGNLKDASDKLSRLSNNDSPLMELLGLALQNTAVDNETIKKTFQPVAASVPAGDRFVGPQNQEYMIALNKLQAAVEALVKASDPNDAGAASQTLAAADATRLTAKQLAQTFNPDPENHVDATVQQLLLDPITNAEALLRGLGPAELNAKGKGLCGQFRAVLGKYPFSAASKLDATVPEVNAILRKPDGALWKFYDESLKKYLTKQGSRYVPVPSGAVTLSPAFVNFFNQAAAFSDFLYAGGSPDPHFSYSLKPVPAEGIQKIGLQIDGQSLEYSSGTTPAAKQFTWQAADPHSAKGTYTAEGASFSDNGGTWAIFRLFGEADSSEPAPGGGEIFNWIIRTGKAGKPSLLPDGKPQTVRLQLDTPGAPPVFEKGFFSRLACVAEVAKP